MERALQAIIPTMKIPGLNNLFGRMAGSGTIEATTEFVELTLKDLATGSVFWFRIRIYDSYTTKKIDEPAVAGIYGVLTAGLGGSGNVAAPGAAPGGPSTEHFPTTTAIPNVGTTSNVNQQLNLATQGPTTAPIVDLGTMSLTLKLLLS